MNNNEDNNFIDVESLPVDNGNNYSQNNNYDQNNVNNGQYNYVYNNEPKHRKSGKVLAKIAGGLLITMLGGVVGSGVTYGLMTKMNKNELSAGTTPQTTTYVPQSFTESSDDAMSAADAFNKVSPAVVIISTVSTATNSSTMFGGSQDVEGMGSGFIINEEGYVLTNYHVINGAKDIKVTLSDGSEVAATVVNYDSDKDIAMIKLKEGTKVPAVAELGDSDELYPGAEVIAIGTPLSKNLAYTLTKGVVSGNNRTLESDNGVKMNLIQTDAAINAGNSGGPLVNTKGQVIGINSMKLGSQSLGTTSIEGIGFAIPINEVKAKIDTLSKQILNLGIKIRPIDSDTASKYDLSEGLYVADVEEYSPAEKGGMKIGDIIVKCDGKSIKTFDELKEVKNTKNEGDTMTVEVIRDKKTVELSIVLEAASTN